MCILNRYCLPPTIKSHPLNYGGIKVSNHKVKRLKWKTVENKQNHSSFFSPISPKPKLTTLISRHNTRENEWQFKEYFFQQPCRLEMHMQLQPKLITEMGTLATLFMKSMFFIKITSYSQVRTIFFS